MRNDNTVLIQRILAGDATAFEHLVRKYQKQVHTLAWRKIGDFHIAEDITQETFLQVYQKLETLEDPTRFPRWLLCHCGSSLYRVAPKKPTTHRTAGKTLISQQ